MTLSSGPRPTAFLACTLKVYVAPFVRPVAVQRRSPGLAIVHVTDGDTETTYGVAESRPGPPSDAGACHEKTAVVDGLPRTDMALRGAEGTVKGLSDTSAVLLTNSVARAVVMATTLMS